MFKATVKALATAALLSATGVAASASETGHIFLDDGRDITNHVELSLVRASSAGRVDIYTYNRNVQGQLLGSRDVKAGANRNLNIRLHPRAVTDLLAVLTINGQVVDTVEVDNLR